MLYRNTQGSKIPLDRSRSREVDKTSIGGSSFRGRTESEGTFYSCESDIDIGDVEDV